MDDRERIFDFIEQDDPRAAIAVDEQIQHARCERFVLRARGKRAPNGKFASTFSVAEQRGLTEVEIMCSSGLLFDTEVEAADDGMRAAKRRLDRTHPGG
jgi:hypothetical protein